MRKETQRSDCIIVTACVKRIYQGNPILVPTSDKKVILIHNCYWHLHNCKYGKVVPATNADFWQKKRSGNKERDKRNIAALKKSGWKVLVVWECQLKNIESLQERMIMFLKD